jgi:hypothetical protein
VEVIKAIRSILVADNTVTSICGERIYAYISPQETAMPFVVVDVVSVTPSDCKNGVSKLDAYRVQIDAVSKSAAQAAKLDDRIRRGLDRIQAGSIAGVAIDGIKYVSGVTLFEEERQARMIATDYNVRVLRDAVLPPIPGVPGLLFFVDDEAAILAGLSVGDYYIIAEGSDVAPAGLLKKVMG